MPRSGGTSNLSMSHLIVTGLTLCSRPHHPQTKGQHANTEGRRHDGARPTFGLGQKPQVRKSAPADSVEKVENRTAPKISRSLAVSTLATLPSADTKVGGWFCAKRCAPSRRRALNVSTIFRTMTRQTLLADHLAGLIGVPGKNFGSNHVL